MEALIGAIGAVVGGMAGAGFTYYLNKPRLRMSLYNISLSPWQPKKAEAIADDIIQHKQGSGFLVTPEETVALFAKHDWTQSLSKTYQHPLLFTWDLYKANRDNEDARIKNEAMPLLIKALKSYLRQDLHEEFYADWLEHQTTLLSLISGEARRNNSSLIGIVEMSQEDIDQNIESLNGMHSIVRDEDGDYYINFGRVNMAFIWSNAGVHKEEVKKVCGTLALAFASWDKRILERLIKFLEGISWDARIFNESAEHIQKMLLRYSRVIIQGVLVNTGRTPLSVLGGAL